MDGQIFADREKLKNKMIAEVSKSVATDEVRKMKDEINFIREQLKDAFHRMKREVNDIKKEPNIFL